MYKTTVRLRLQHESPDVESRLREALSDFTDRVSVDVVGNRLVHIWLEVQADSIEDAVAKTIRHACDAVTVATQAGYAILYVDATA